MTHAAADVGTLVEELMPLLAMLWALVPEPGGSPATGTMSHHKALGSPAPWHQEAGPVLYTISEDARRLEASLRKEITGHPGRRRGGSDANTVEALTAISALAYGVPEESGRKAGQIIARWIRDARRVRDLGLDERPTRLPREPGEREPMCPYCHTYSLRVAPRDTALWCINWECKDRGGHRPRGHLDRSDLTGDPMIVWADGRLTRRRDLA